MVGFFVVKNHLIKIPYVLSIIRSVIKTFRIYVIYHFFSHRILIYRKLVRIRRRGHDHCWRIRNELHISKAKAYKYQNQRNQYFARKTRFVSGEINKPLFYHCQNLNKKNFPLGFVSHFHECFLVIFHWNRHLSVFFEIFGFFDYFFFCDFDKNIF